jgi:gamma-tubulin complex component 3
MCVPLFDMIRRWVFEGVLEDPACEFFVVPCNSSDSSSSNGLSTAAAGSSRDLWRDAYRLEPACVPPFITAELAETILRAGKSINFLRDACGDARWVQEWAPAAAGTAAALGYGQVRAVLSQPKAGAVHAELRARHILRFDWQIVW